MLGRGPADVLFTRSKKVRFTVHQPDEYPQTVAEVLDDTITFKPSVLAAATAFKRSHPWRGSIDERQAKLRAHEALCDAYRLDPRPALLFNMGQSGRSDRSYFDPSANIITLVGRLSVVTYLHEFAHARGMDERQACRWSVNLFRRVWPRLYERCRHDGHMLRAPLSRRT